MTDVTFDPTAVDQIDQSSIEAGGPQYPTVQWHYGGPRMKKAGGMDYEGGWFAPADQVDPEKLEAAGWEPATWEHVGGAATEGFWKREIVVAVIAMRKRWEVYGDAGMRAWPWNAYETAKTFGRPSSRTHVLCLIKGLEDLDAFVLTLKGSAAMAFEGTRNAEGALSKFANTVIRAANQASDAAAKKAGKPGGKRWPYRAFWLPVGAARKADGEPLFTEVGRAPNNTSIVLPVPLGLPDKAESAQLNRYYVGNELLHVVNALWEEAQEGWSQAWDNIDANASQAEDGGGSSDGDSGGNGNSAAAVVADDKTLEELGL